MILLFDMDGVLTEFVGHAAKTFNKNHEEMLRNWQGVDIEPNLGVTKSEFWKTIDKIPDWWESMPKTSECDELLKIADSYESYICTSPASNPVCASGKLRWLNKHTNFRRNIVISPQKWLCAGPDRVLIDDTDEKIEKFEKFGGHGLTLPRCWNKNRGISDPVGYVKTELVRLERLINESMVT